MDILRRIIFLGSTPATFGEDKRGATVTVERYIRGGARRFRVVRHRADGFAVTCDSHVTSTVASHVKQAIGSM